MVAIMIRWKGKKIKINTDDLTASSNYYEPKTVQEILDEISYYMDIQIVKQVMDKHGGCFCRNIFMIGFQKYLNYVEKV